MIWRIMVYIFLFYFGVRFGMKIRTKQMDAKKEEIMVLMQEVKDKNNQMLTNFSKLYDIATGNNGKWTETDEFVMSMWME